MTCYAIGHLRDVRVGGEIVAYLEQIDATLAPFGGRFLIHGARPTHLEGEFPGDLVVIAFDDRQSAEGWYRSSAYARILPLRAENAVCEVFLIDGVDADHRATDILA
jgi:uncharacterized protein (DUF1330 family)